MTDFDDRIGPALRDRLRTEQPDLEHLATASLRAGLRLRRRRRVATVAGGTAAFAVVGVGVAVTQGGSGTTARDHDFADTPTAPTTASATVTADPEDAAGLPTGEPANAAPFTIDAPGWSCGDYLDEKIPCTKDDSFVSINVRPAAEHDAWASDPDKGGSSLWVSPVHGDFFVSVQGGAGSLSQTDLTALIDGITFAP
jgi:hypothetical protein